MDILYPLSNGGHNDQHHEDRNSVTQNVTATFVVISVSSYIKKKELCEPFAATKKPFCIVRMYHVIHVIK